MDNQDKSEDLLREFISRLDSGESVSPEEYYLKYPELENELKVLFDKIKGKKFEKIDLKNEPAKYPQTIGDFKIISKIDEGGMGIVFEAEQISLHRKVALKILAKHLCHSEKAILKFRREAESCGRLKHPNIVAIYAFGQHEGIHYIAQELVESGITLADKLDELRQHCEPNPGFFREMAQFFVVLADALEHSHSSGVIHRDIKPSNILLTKDGTPKISDFGLAMIEDVLTLSRTGELAGTPYYMSPEQAMCKRIGIDHRTDVYSLGVTLYEMLCLKRPFEGKTSQEVLKKILLVDPTDPHKAYPKVPRDLSTICLKAMEKLPESRYQTMNDFYDDLRRYLSGDVILAKPSGLGTRLWKRIRRNPVVSGAVCAASLALLCIAVWGVVYYIQLKIKNAQINRLIEINSIEWLEAEVDTLWPAYPEKIPDMEKWLHEVSRLEERIEDFQLLLSDLKGRYKLNFKEDTLLSGLERLVGWLEDISNDEKGCIKHVQERLYFARTIHQKSIVDKTEEWNYAIESISNKKECPIYKGLSIKEQIGFVPLGKDPYSGLWEFAHLQTGEIPKRNEKRNLIIKEKSGMVFVLLPGQSSKMGAVRPSADHKLGDPHVDPNADANESPVHDVRIEAFLISKYEMTQGQWFRIMKQNPSYYKAGNTQHGLKITYLHPVEMVTWHNCYDIMKRLNLRLPTESEWEYACRAGKSTVFWTGNNMKSLDGAVNVCDVYCMENGGHSSWPFEKWLNDGYAIHSPVGTYLPNPFGLFDVCGNVFEWCQDTYGGQGNLATYDRTPRDGTAFEIDHAPNRIGRGGSWFKGINFCRSAARGWSALSRQDSDIGLRPAYSLK